MNSWIRLSIRGTSLVMLLLGIAMGSGCARVVKDRPMVNYTGEGMVETFKRIEDTPARDFWHHWTRQAYFTPERAPGKLGPLSEDSALILEHWGSPDRVRRPYRSIHGDKVHEWIYLDAYRVFQFVDGALVYEGPLTAYEQLLMRRGYPSSVIQILEGNSHLETFVYSKIFKIQVQQYTFHDHVLSQQKEGS